MSVGWFVDLKQVPRSFVMFQFALLFDAFGSTMWALVFPLVVVSLTHSAFWTTLVTGGGFAAAPLAPWLGAQVDRADKRRLWQSTTLLEATAVGVFAMTIRSDHMMPLYVVMAVFLGITSRLRTLCLGPIARAHVPPTARVGFNSFASTVALVAGYVGPGVGGIILPWLGPTLALAINAVTDLFPLLASGRIPTVPPSSQTKTTHHFEDYLERWRQWWRIPTLRLVVSVRWLRLILGTGVATILIYYLRQTLGLPSAWIGVAAVSSGLLPLAMGPLTPVVLRRVPAKTLLCIMLGLAGLGFGALALCHTWWEVAATLGIVEATMVPESTLQSVLLQQHIPTGEYAQTNGMIGMVTSLGILFITVIFSLLATVVSVRVLIAGVGIVLLGVSLVLTRHPIAVGASDNGPTTTPPHYGT